MKRLIIKLVCLVDAARESALSSLKVGTFSSLLCTFSPETVLAFAVEMIMRQRIGTL